MKKERSAVLQALSTDHRRLKNIARDFDIDGVDLRSSDAILQALRRHQQATLDELIDYLGESEVKELCDSLKLESRGRRRYLIEMVLREAAKTDDGPKGEADSGERRADLANGGGDLSKSERRLLDHVPLDGSTIGNKRLRENLGWEEERYRRVRDKLIEKEILGVGAGRGGSVYRKLLDASESSSPGQGGVNEAQRQREEALYGALREAIEENWSQLFPGFPAPVRRWLDSSPRLGSKATGGKWTRPDISAVTINQYHYIPGKHLDVFTFEVKPRDQLNVIGVYEALAHSRRSNFAYALYHVSPNAEPPEFEGIVREATRLRIGVVTFEDPANFDTWTVRCVPQRHDTEPRYLNEFIETLPKKIRDEISLEVR